MKILFVEDDDLNREVIAEYLELNGYNVCALPNGFTFLQSLAEFQPNLILLDLKLPGIDGFTLMEQLRQSQWAQLPVVVLSGLSFSKDRQRALQLGVRRFLVKPTILPEIVNVIQQELRDLS
ncbi:MAG TPA: response regulator [Cyanobacteria bacterium UBA8803]|nr:response regulator [Cyanobacteria bacterium UBA9273]HBL60350.1 response regulator [Cyanobacteria bacterium UBA8803]